MSEESQLKKAQEHLKNKAYAQAWNILVDIPDNPKARQYMGKLLGARTQLSTRSPKNTEAALKKARQSISDKDYGAAWAILKDIPDDSTARKWMHKLLGMSAVSLAASSSGGGSALRRVLVLLVGIVLIGAVVFAALQLTSDDAPDGASGDNRLTQSITVERENGPMTVRYPEGWVAREDISGFVDIANSQEALDEDNDLSPGEISGVVLDRLDSEALQFIAANQDASLEEFAEEFADFATSEESGLTEVNTETFRRNNREGAMLTGSFTTEDGEELEAVLILTRSGVVSAFTFSSAPGESAQFKDELQAIATSITFGDATEQVASENADDNAEPEQQPSDNSDNNDNAGAGALPPPSDLPQSITMQVEMGELTISYPEGWVAEDFGGGSIAIANGQDVLESFNTDNSQPLPGQVAGVAIGPFDAMTLGIMTGVDIAADTGLDQIIGSLTIEFALGDEEGGFSVRDSVSFFVGNKQGMVLFGTNTLEGEAIDSVIGLVREGDSFAVVLLAALEGEAEQFRDEILAIVESVAMVPATAAKAENP